METRKLRFKTRCLIAGAAIFVGLLPLASASAHHDPQGVIAGDRQEAVSSGGSTVAGLEAMRQRMEARRERPHMHAAMMQRDAVRAAAPSNAFDDGDDHEDEAGGLPSRLDLVSRGRRLEPDATTDVWALGRFAYTGTFNSPCGGEAGAGVHVWKVRKVALPLLLGLPGDHKPIAFVEDTAVAPERVPAIVLRSGDSRCG